MTRPAAILAVLALSACAYDPGGPVMSRAAQIEADPPGRLEHIVCASACTMRLARDCVGPGATFIFHGPRLRSTGEPAPRFDHYSRVMADHYPPDLAAWFMEVGRFGPYRLTGAQVVAMGAMPCAPTRPPPP